MNFDVIPGAHSTHGFVICVLVMVLVCIGLYALLRRRKWL